MTKLKIVVADAHVAAGLRNLPVLEVTEVFDTAEGYSMGLIPDQARAMLAALQGWAGRQPQDRIEQLSVELTAERARRIAAEAEVERMKRGVADVLERAAHPLRSTQYAGLSPPAVKDVRSPRSAPRSSRK